MGAVPELVERSVGVEALALVSLFLSPFPFPSLLPSFPPLPPFSPLLSFHLSSPPLEALELGEEVEASPLPSFPPSFLPQEAYPRPSWMISWQHF